MYLFCLCLQLKELEDEWAKLDATPPTPTRYTRSQQAKMAAAPPPDTSGGDAETDEGSGGIYAFTFHFLFIHLVILWIFCLS